MSNIAKLSRIDYNKIEFGRVVSHVVLYDSTKITALAVTDLIRLDPSKLNEINYVLDVTLPQFNTIINPMLEAIKELSKEIEEPKNSADSEVTIKIPSLCGTTIDMPISSVYAMSSIFRSVMRDYEEEKKVKESKE